MVKAKKAAVKHLTEKQERINALEKQLASLDSERERCQDMIKLGTVDKERIQQLKILRDEEIATAFLDKRDALLTSIDSSIADEEAAAAKALANAEAAKLALALVERKFVALDAEITGARGELKHAVILEMESRAEALMSDYLHAVESIGEIMIEMAATNHVMLRFGKLPNGNGLLPGQYLFDRLEKERLPIPWSHSKRTYPGARFCIDGQEPLMMDSPAWMIDRQRQQNASTNLMAELASAGIQPT